MTDLARGRELEARCALTPYSESNYRAWSKWLHTNSPALLAAAEREAAMREVMEHVLDRWASLANLPIEDNPSWIDDCLDEIIAYNKWADAAGKPRWPYGAEQIAARRALAGEP